MGREHLWFLSATSLNAEAQKKTWEDHGIFILFPGSLLSAAMPGISLRPYSVAVQSRTFWASEPDFLIWSGHFLPSCEEKQKHFLGSPVLTSSQDTQMPRNILAMPCVPVWCRIGPWCFLLQVLGHISRAQRMRSRCWQDQVGIWESEDMFGKGMLAHSKPHPMHHAHVTPHASARRLFPPREKCHKEGGTMIRKPQQLMVNKCFISLPGWM